MPSLIYPTRLAGPLALLIVVILAGVTRADDATAWRAGFANPPLAARSRAYWWWLNGNVTKASISNDLEEMKAKGMGGALIFDADGSSQNGNGEVPAGPMFGSPEWRALFKHTLSEANRLGLEIDLNITSGWNLGGPMVTPAMAMKTVTWSETRVTGGGHVSQVLQQPKSKGDFYRDIAVVAYPARPASDKPHAPIKWFEEKALYKELGNEFGGWTGPDATPLLKSEPETPGEEDLRSQDQVDLTKQMNGDGKLEWDAPAGDWVVLRFGYTLTGARTSTSSGKWEGLSIDHLKTAALDAYWQQVVEPLLADAGTMCGKTLTRLQTDSWEMGLCNWTDDFAEQFRSRRGYEITPYIAALAGKIVGSRDVTNRFLYDFRKTVGDCIADDHYRAFAERAHARGLGIQCESGGPHGAPIDALKCLGRDDMPMGEFWAPSNQHRVKPQERFFMKQSASAAHIYGHPRACGEGFTSIGPHWEETPWSLKTAFDTEACEGLNLIYWHAFVCSPAETGMPGQQYFAGSHLNPKVTWWNDAGAFMSYMNRCQYLLQQGLFVADAVYYYGDSVPNFARLKSSDPAHVLPGRDYDVCDEEVLLTRMSVKGARIVLPDGMTYRVLVLPDRQSMPPAVLAKIAELVKAGATVIGPKPTAAAGLADYPQCDAKVAALADEVWGTCDGKTITENRYGQGRVVWGKTAKQVLEADGVPMDFATEAKLDYIHRAGADGDIYFITNPADVPVDTTCTFRVSAKAAQMWWPDYGKIHRAAMTSGNGTAAMPLHLNGRGSMFVVFGAAADGPPQSLAVDSTSAPPIEINGLWTVHFEPGWGAPESIAFPKLISWTDNADPNIKFFSGTATYSVDVGVPAGDHDWVLDLGEVDDLARVKVNGTDVGVVWEKPARIDVSGAWRPGRNTIEIAVTNLWPNRLIGDAGLPPEQRRTRTNIRKFTGKSPLRPSGLLGPVRLIPQAAQQETTQ